ncbi:MAG: NAD(P)H-binding protein [Limnobacter sp.]|nr:NAD(P)H-binding protein [Limnobacter sp.]
MSPTDQADQKGQTGQTILVAGATGAVGQQVLKLASQHAGVAHIVALTRRPLPETFAKVSNEIVDFLNLPEDAPWWQADAVICALGTTRKQAGSAEAFERVDYEMVAELAHKAAAKGIARFVLNSSMMANPNAPGLYLKTKGRAEQAVIAAGFESVVLARPGLLDASREESRPGEFAGILASRLFNPVLPKRYRSVKVDRLAAAMLEHSLKAVEGVTTLESERFQSSA